MGKFLFGVTRRWWGVFMFLFVNQPFAQDIRYQKRYFIEDLIPGQSPTNTNFYDIESLKDGGFLVQGFLTDSLNNQFGYLGRFDCMGKALWGKTLGRSGSPTNTVFGAVETENGDIAFSYNLGVGFFQASILCGLLSADGSVKWIKRIGNSTEFGRDIAQSPDGGYVVVGSTGFFGTDRRAADIYIIKLSAGGDILWTKTLGTPNGTYDEAFAVKIDKHQRIVVTGRCIADNTFQAFILKLSMDGNLLACKTYGYTNQRTNAFDVLVDSENNYVITGFTTILEIDHASSEADPFVIKTDSLLNPIFMNVYEVSIGRDFSTLGESLALLDNGDYAVGVSTLSFSRHDASGPNSPSKNALYVVKKDGALRKAYLYNQKGSQYTRVRKSYNGGVVMSGFTTAYANNVSFQGLIIQTDPQFLSGCHDIDVTSEINTFQPAWQVADYIPEIKIGKTEVPYSNYRDSLLNSSVVCEEFPVLTPDFIAPDTACPGPIFLEPSTSGPNDTMYWIIENDTFPNRNGLRHDFLQPGTFQVTLVMKYRCLKEHITKNIHILPGGIRSIHKTLCEGQTFTFLNKTYSHSTKDTLLVKTESGCDSVYFINVQVHRPSVVNLDTAFCGDRLVIKNTAVEKDTALSFDTFDENGCLRLKENIRIRRYYDLQPLVLDSLISCESIFYRDSLYSQSTTVKFDSLAPDGCKIYPKETLLSLKTIELPNVFFPNNQGGRNHVFRPVNLCHAAFSHYRLQIFNRWGQKVFETSDPETSWNGQYEGQGAPIETYLVYFEYSLRNLPGRVFKKRGDVNIIR